MAAESSARDSRPPAERPTPIDVSDRSALSPVLLDGSAEGRLLPRLIDRLQDPNLDRIDMAVSFVMKSGLARIIQPLEDALDRGAHVRILTTDYLAITDPDALTQLADLAEGGGHALEVRVFSGGSVAFHPKAYIFWSSAGEAAAGYVGSSNLSASGIDGGVEWNLGVARVEQLVAGFESLWADERTRRLNARTLSEYRETWRRSARRVVTPQPDPESEPVEESQPAASEEILRHLVGVADELPTQPVAPRPIQTEALAALERTRADGFDRAFVVMATGLGKTWLAAFDSARPEFRRVLFVAHREEILRQSRDVFRRVRPDADLGLFMGDEKVRDAEAVFASVQTLHRHLDRFARAAFDYVVIDEFHHAAASTYRRVLGHFEPKFLLGLTATPDRRDGADLLALCGDNLVFDCGLAEGIRREELSPFHYWGIADVTDYDPIPWRSGRFDPESLATAIETRERATKAFREWRAKGGGPTLAFCSSISHAEFMKVFFVAEGVRSATVHSGSDSDPRHRSIAGPAVRRGRGAVRGRCVQRGGGYPRGRDRADAAANRLAGRLPAATRPGPAPDSRQSGSLRDRLRGQPPQLPNQTAHAPLAGRPERHRTRRSSRHCRAAISSCRRDVRWTSTWKRSRSSAAYRRHRRARPQDSRSSVATTSQRTASGPTAAQAFSSVGVQTSTRPVRHANGWHRYLNGLGLLAPEEQAVVEVLGDVIRSLEREPITRAYKLVTLSALLTLDALHTGASIAEVASVSLTLTRRDPRLRADTEQTRAVSDLRSVDPGSWRAFWMKNPLTHLTDKPQSLFRLAGERLEPRFDVHDEHATTFSTLVSEIVEWRLQIYLRNRGGKEGSGSRGDAEAEAHIAS